MPCTPYNDPEGFEKNTWYSSFLKKSDIVEFKASISKVMRISYIWINWAAAPEEVQVLTSVDDHTWENTIPFIATNIENSNSG